MIRPRNFIIFCSIAGIISLISSKNPNFRFWLYMGFYIALIMTWFYYNRIINQWKNIANQYHLDNKKLIKDNKILYEKSLEWQIEYCKTKGGQYKNLVPELEKLKNSGAKKNEDK